MRPAQQAALQKGRVLMSTGNRPLTKTIRSSHANHEASSIDIVQQQRKFGKVILRQLLIGVYADFFSQHADCEAG